MRKKHIIGNKNWGLVFHMGLLPTFLILLGFFVGLINSLDSNTSIVFIKDSETISSSNGAFKLGFFSHQNITDLLYTVTP